jgi:excisionase family DNA binding protein
MDDNCNTPAAPADNTLAHGGAADADEFLTAPEAAKRMRTCTETVRRLIRAGELPAIKPVHRVLIRATDLAMFMKRAAVAA